MAGNLPNKHGTPGTYTNTGIVSLASDTNLLAGWQTTVVDNTSVLADDYLVSAKIKGSGTPTAGKQIEFWAFGDVDDAGTYVGGFGATTAGLTVPTANQKPMLMVLVATIVLDDTTVRSYGFWNRSLKSLLGYIPGHHGLWIVHNSGTALSATAGDFVFYYVPVFWQYT